jgi:hypothetical protein
LTGNFVAQYVFHFRFKRDITVQETGVAGLQSPAYDLDHQHKYPEGGKMQVPSAPREQLQTKPVIEGAVHKSKFEYPLGDMDKPEIPKDLNGKSK